MTNEYSAGDLVEISKGDVIIRDRLAESLYKDGQLFLPNQHPQKYIDALIKDGWTATVIEKAAPKNVMPTEAGIYADNEGDPWKATRNDHGDIEWQFGALFIPEVDVIEHGPFTQLTPGDVTARKILNRILEDNTGDGGYFDHRYTARSLAMLFAEFGVEVSQ